MAALEDFRAETRAWLEANCPASMRTPMTGEETPWGGRKGTFKNPDTKVRQSLYVSFPTQRDQRP